MWPSAQAIQLLPKLVILLRIREDFLRSDKRVLVVFLVGNDENTELASLGERSRAVIERVCRDHGFEPPLIGTPIEFQETDDEP